MSLDPCDYGWTVGVHGFEPVPTLDPMAPEELLQFTSCNCKGDCSNRRCSCKKNGVQCIVACGNCRNSFQPNVEEDFCLYRILILAKKIKKKKERGRGEKWVWPFQPQNYSDACNRFRIMKTPSLTLLRKNLGIFIFPIYGLGDLTFSSCHGFP